MSRTSIPVPHIQSALPYRLRPSILTPTELHFYHVLRQATEAAACIKPRIADILETPRRDCSALANVKQKHCDFVLCEPATMRPILAVELDAYTHDRPDRHAYDLPRLRDAITRASWMYHGAPPAPRSQSFWRKLGLAWE